MLPHQQLLGLPPMQKYRRRSINIALQTHTTTHKRNTDTDIESIDDLNNIVHIREINVTVGGLGCSIWDGSIILARYIQHNKHLFYNHTVLELGAGIGLPSLVLSRYAKRCIVTDYIDELLDNYKYNMNVNANTDDLLERCDGGTSDVQQLIQQRNNMKQYTETVYLDWHIVEDVDTDDETDCNDIDNATAHTNTHTNSENSLDAELELISNHKLPKLELNNEHSDYTQRPHGIGTGTHLSYNNDPIKTGTHNIDCIIAAEVLYTPNAVHAYCLMRILYRYLKPGGIFYCVQSVNREGQQNFIKLLQHKGFDVQFTVVTDTEPMVGLLGHYGHANDKQRGTGFVQRDEQYVLFTIKKLTSDELLQRKHNHAGTVALPSLSHALDEDTIVHGEYDVRKAIVLPKPTTVT